MITAFLTLTEKCHFVKLVDEKRKRPFDEEGSASIEFLLVFPVMFFLFFWIVETGLIMMRWIILEHSSEIVSRDLKVHGVPSSLTKELEIHNYLVSELCSNMVLVEDCDESLKVQIENVAAGTGIPPKPISCINKSNNVNPMLINFGEKLGADARDIVLMRVCLSIDPIISSRLLLPLAIDADGFVNVYSETVFISEPD